MLSPSNMRSPIFVALTMTAAFSCMMYELVLAQTSSVLLGDALVHYSATICIFLISLGIGAWLCERFPRLTEPQSLIVVEIVLSYLGPLAPIAGLTMEFLLRTKLDPGTPLFQHLLEWMTYLLIAAVGILSGIELPCLISLGEEKFGVRSGMVLGWDYLGTLLAVVIFPTLALGKLGLFGAAALSGIANGLSSTLALFALPRPKGSGLFFLALIPSMMICALSLIFADEIRQALANWIYLVKPHE